MAIKNIGIGWQLHNRTGWGVYGINLALQLLARTGYHPVLLFKPGRLPENPLLKTRLEPLLEEQSKLSGILEQIPGFSPPGDNLITLTGLGNDFVHQPSPFQSPAEAGVIFFENTRFSRQGWERACRFPLIVTGSSWNTEVLKAKKFPGRLATVIQGIDPTIFHPAPRAGLFKDRFVIFSGGKLEYRKGQDIVIAAYRKFHQRHPESLLLCAWHNSWPESMREIARAGLVNGSPANSQPQTIAAWLVANGLPPSSFEVLAEAPNIYMAPVMREADVALFPNRGEGGTNLVAMEALACGLPVVLAANSGQLDFADPEICFPLQTQGLVKPSSAMPGVEGWGESDIDEIIETLETIYQDRDQGHRRGEKAAIRMQSFTWERQVDHLLAVLEENF